MSEINEKVETAIKFLDDAELQKVSKGFHIQQSMNQLRTAIENVECFVAAVMGRPYPEEGCDENIIPEFPGAIMSDMPIELTALRARLERAVAELREIFF